ncbi:restriction endonuclease subunit S [Aliarcobacter skirrowii]|uniref:restriction endonuclease subunit S n=1 Tax=Aliarcobacter skirrowii TaxID=28200 RepID=UPI000D60A7E6|nr:restriction endonuclease subunit S [Aliarcobacter skirrowii]PWE21790.1 type I restriction endonuclease subunit S [Aliarcobacter skirrowii]PWE24999.1 type I restriction endonuclease subunit S [Aliarcobacter skirrowii]RJO56123.1 type I restriction endonuclease subunit S [Aliarcobacter skirrowii]RJO58078.1 type I restriction endonuclease subunit S [Aliarcobacter skirrowii]
MSELYNLPNGWEWKKLGDLTTTTSGGTPKRNEKLYWGGNIGWLKSGELNDGYITNVEEYITDEGLTKSSAKLFPKGTLLIAMYGATVGKLGILEIETTTNQAICGILNDKNKFETLFMFYYLKKIREKMIEDSFGGAQPNLSQTYIKDLDIPLPPLEEQKRIVAKLDNLFAKIDKAIALHQKNIDEADIFMASVLNDVFVDLEEKYGKQLLLDGVYIGCKKGFKPTIINGKVPFIGMSDIDEHNGINTKYVMEDYGNVSNGKTKFEKNAVLVGKITPCTQNNKTTIVPSNIDGGFATTEVYALHSMSNMNPYYLNHFMRSKEVNEFLVSTMVGATGRQRVPSESIKNLQISIPPLKTQQKVVAYLDEISNKMEKIKNLQKAKMQSLKELKASILDKAFKGEL